MGKRGSLDEQAGKYGWASGVSAFPVTLPPRKAGWVRATSAPAVISTVGRNPSRQRPRGIGDFSLRSKWRECPGSGAFHIPKGKGCVYRMDT